MVATIVALPEGRSSQIVHLWLKRDTQHVDKNKHISMVVWNILFLEAIHETIHLIYLQKLAGLKIDSFFKKKKNITR